MLRVGVSIKGYTIISQIGKGGMSKVWLAEDSAIQKKWAIKEIDKHTEEFRRNVRPDGKLDEIEILKKIDSPYTPRIVDLLENDDVLCVIMDYISGENLFKRLARGGPVKENLAAEWISDVCTLLSYLHRKGIIYRDIKPANIILTDEETIKVIDFGIAKEVSNGVYRDAVVYGTKGYTAPEHLNHHTDEKTDQYSVGVTLYQLLTGENPAENGFEIRHLRDINRKFSNGLDEIIQKATDPNPNNRFKDMDEMAVALKNYKKLDGRYFRKIKRRVRVSNFLRNLASIFFIMAFCLYAAGYVKDLKQYRELINQPLISGKNIAESYEAAIDLRPYDPQAYLLLIEAFEEDGLSEEEAGSLSELFAGYSKASLIKLSGYAEVAHNIGDAYLLYYDKVPINNLIARLEFALPYYEISALSRYEMSELASAFIYFSRFDTSRQNGEELTAAGANEFISKAHVLMTYSQRYLGKGATRSRLVSGCIIADELSKNSAVLLKAGVSKTNIENLASEIVKLTDVEAKDNEDSQLKTKISGFLEKL